MKIASSTQLIPGDTFFDKIIKASSYGFEGLEIRMFETEASQKKIKEILRAFDASNLQPSSFILAGDPLRRPLCDEESKQAKIEHAKRTLDYAAQLG